MFKKLLLLSMLSFILTGAANAELVGWWKFDEASGTYWNWKKAKLKSEAEAKAKGYRGAKNAYKGYVGVDVDGLGATGRDAGINPVGFFTDTGGTDVADTDGVGRDGANIIKLNAVRYPGGNDDIGQRFEGDVAHGQCVKQGVSGDGWSFCHADVELYGGN